MSVIKWYKDLVEDGSLLEDEEQLQAAKILNDFAAELTKSPRRRSFLGRHNKDTSPKGVYIYGEVGRGKTLLMDGFFLNLEVEKKKRVHFHSYMRHFHEKMREIAQSDKKEEAIKQIAAEFEKEYRVLCFDEFHISDIADAMIMASMLKEMLKRNVKFVMTSNYHPDSLYPNGLARHLFLPAIKLIMDNFIVLDLDAKQDYRQLSLSDGDLYFYPHNKDIDKRMNKMFDKIACGIVIKPEVTIQGRKVQAIRRTSDAIWFSFVGLCQGARSHLDYLRLAERFSTIFLSDVPQLTTTKLAEASRRFTWLVDILYDRKVVLVMSAAVPLRELYGELGNSAMHDERHRTISRLKEMQSSAYLAKKAVK